MKWCKDNHYPSEGENFLGSKLGSNEKPKLGWSYYTYLKKKFKNTPWIDNVDDKENDIYCLYEDLVKPFLKKNHVIFLDYIILKKKFILKMMISMNHTLIFFQDYEKASGRKVAIVVLLIRYFWKTLLSQVNNNFPNLKIVIHGHQESCRNLLLEYKNIIFTDSIKDSIKFLSDSDLLITPISGFGRLAMNCGIKNLIEVLQPKHII